MAEIDAFFKLMHEQGASDLHLSSGQQPALRLHGDIQRIKYDILTSDKLRGLLYEITSQEKIKTFEETGDVDFGYEIPGLARYRANYFMQKNGISAVFREITSEILTAEQLGLPPVISKLAELPRGLVLVTGPTGSGKSTTLAAIIDQANKIRKDHIITVEDPIEFVHRSQNCIVSHREVGQHTKTFSSALMGHCARTPILSSWVNSGTLKPFLWPLKPHQPVTWFLEPFIHPVPPKPWTGLSRSFHPRSRPRFAPPWPTDCVPLLPRPCLKESIKRADVRPLKFWWPRRR